MYYRLNAIDWNVQWSSYYDDYTALPPNGLKFILQNNIFVSSNIEIEFWVWFDPSNYSVIIGADADDLQSMSKCFPWSKCRQNKLAFLNESNWISTSTNKGVHEVITSHTLW